MKIEKIIYYNLTIVILTIIMLFIPYTVRVEATSSTSTEQLFTHTDAITFYITGIGYGLILGLLMYGFYKVLTILNQK